MKVNNHFTEFVVLFVKRTLSMMDVQAIPMTRRSLKNKDNLRGCKKIRFWHIKHKPYKIFSRSAVVSLFINFKDFFPSSKSDKSNSNQSNEEDGGCN